MIKKPPSHCKSIVISPQDTVINVGDSQIYTCEAFDKKGVSRGDITDWVKFNISSDAGGTWTDNTYHSSNLGSWTVTAKFRRRTAKALLSVNEMPTPPLSLPPPIAGSLYRTFGSVGEYEDVIAFIYNHGGNVFAHIESSEGSRDYLLPDSEGIYRYYVKTVLTARDELWVAFNVPIKINRYHIGQDGLTLMESVIFGDSATRLVEFTRLASGKLFVAWYQHVANLKDTEGNPGINVGFAYTDSSGLWKTIPYTWVYPNHWSTHATVCQHPDGSIWWFSISDGNHTIKVIHLVENGDNIAADWVDYRFLSKDDDIDMHPEGELPWLSSTSSENSIILAYQDMNRIWFSYDPFCKGAKVAVVPCNSDGSRELLFVLDRWLERSIQFNVGITIDGHIWLAYGMIDGNNLTWNDLYISKSGLDDRSLGKLKGGIPHNAGITLTTSSKWLITNMADDYIHFFDLSP